MARSLSDGFPLTPSIQELEYSSAKLPFVRPSGSIFVSFVCIGQLATVSVSVKVLSDRKLPVSGSEVADNRRKLPVSRSGVADIRKKLPVSRSGRLTTSRSCRSPGLSVVVEKMSSSSSQVVKN